MNSRHYSEERTSEQKEVAWKRLIDEAKPLPKMERDKCEQFLEDGINEALWLIKHVEVRGGVNFLSVFDSKRDGAEYRRNEHYYKSLSLVWIRIQEDLGNTFFFNIQEV